MYSILKPNLKFGGLQASDGLSHGKYNQNSNTWSLSADAWVSLVYNKNYIKIESLH